MKESTTITSLFTTAYVCEDCKKFYTSVKDEGGIRCPKCRSLLFSKPLKHRILHIRKGNKTLLEVTESKALSGFFNIELPPKGSYEESLRLLSLEDLK